MTTFQFSSGRLAEIDGVTLSVGGSKIHTVIETRNIPRDEVYYDFLGINRSFQGQTTIAEWNHFLNWMTRYNVKLATEPERNPPLNLFGTKIVGDFIEGPTPVQAKNKPGCPECWDTGFRHGFGAPCSHGCKP